MRTLLTVRQISADNCKTVDSGFQIDTAAFDLANLPTEAQANACRPPFCATFGGPGTKKPATVACQQPFIRNYFDLPGQGSHFQPFGTAQLDWEPRGHAPTGIYDDPHFDFHLYYTTAAEVEAISVGECSNVGFLSADAWRRSLKPMPAQCFPTGAFTNTALAVSGMGTHLVNVLSPEFKVRTRRREREGVAKRETRNRADPPPPPPLPFSRCPSTALARPSSLARTTAGSTLWS